MPPNTPGFVPGLGVQKPSQIPQITPTPDVPVSYPVGLFTQLVRRPYRTTYVSYGFLYPVVVGAAVVAPMVSGAHIQMSRVPAQARQTRSVLRLPAVVGPGVVFRPISARLAPQPRVASSQRYRLYMPATVGAGVKFSPVRVSSARTPRSSFHAFSRLAPPAVIGAGIVFSPVRTDLVRTPRTRTVSILFPATAVSPPVLSQPVRVNVTQTPRSRFRFWSRLAAPPKILAAVQPLAQPIRVSIVRTPLARFKTLRRLAPPTFVGVSAPPVATVIRSSLSWRLHPFRKTVSVLGAPVTVGTPAQIVARISRFLAVQPTQTRHVGRFGVAPPQIVDLPPAQVTLSVRLAAQPRLGRRSFYRINRPSIVTAPKPSSDQLRLRVSYTRSHRISRGSHNTNLRPPTVVGAFVPPPPPPVPAPTWSPFIDGPQQKHAYTAPELWYGDKPPPRRKR